MKILKLFLAIILTALISGLYGVFQNYVFDYFIVMPIFVSLMISIVFIRVVKFEKFKKIVCALLIGLVTYSVFIGVSYKLYLSDIRAAISQSNYDIDNVDEAIDNYFYFETRHKDLMGYIFIRTKSIPITMEDAYARAESSGISLPNYQGILGEVVRALAMLFMPLLVSLPSAHQRRL